MRVFILCFLVVCGLVGAQGVVAQSSCNQEGKRFALVIGNQIYEDKSKTEKTSYGTQVGSDMNIIEQDDNLWKNLLSPHDDAEEMTLALQKLEFNVTLVKDAELEQMKNIINEFFEIVKKDTHATTLFYFSGHGTIGSGGETLLVPVKQRRPIEDMESENGKPTPKWDGVYALSEILANMPESKCSINIVILDVCRTASDMKGGQGDREYFDKLSRPGLLIAYASAPGQKSSEKLYFSDSDDECGSSNTGQPDNNKCKRLSLYTRFLLEYLPRHGPYYEVFENTRLAVLNHLKRKNAGNLGNNGQISQMPREDNSLLGTFYFVSPKIFSGGFQ